MSDESNTAADTSPVLDGVKQAFAPVSEAFKSLQNLQVPEATREFFKRTASNGKERTADLHDGVDKITSAVESAVTNSVAEATKVSRNIQQAFFQDTEAFFSGIDRLASAKSLNEAVQIQSDLLRSHSEVLMARAKSSTEYFGKLVSDSTKTAQDNFSRIYSR